MKSKLAKTVKSGKAPAQKKAKSTTKRVAAKKTAPRWKVVGDKVVFKPGRYTLADIESALKALERGKP